MNAIQLAELQKLQVSVISAADLVNKNPRTLLLGCTVEGHSWHVYLGASGKIYRVEHLAGALIARSASTVRANTDFVPDKRLMPESCDFEFCALLAKAGLELPFSAFEKNAHTIRVEQHYPYAGPTIEDFQEHGTRRLLARAQTMEGSCAPARLLMAA